MSQNDEPRELKPLTFTGVEPDSEEALYDFRPRPVSADAEEIEVIPKGESAAASVDSKSSRTSTTSESLENSGESAPADAEPGKPKESEAGQQDSSTDETTSGDSEPPV